jgi:hypothetical protein
MVKDNRKYAAMMLDKLVELDKQTMSAYYEMGRILAVFKNDKLFDVLGYQTWSEMVEEELSYTATSASHYVKVYQDFRRLKYNKNEAIQLINEFGYTNMRKVLPTLKQKIGKRALKNRVDTWPEHQLNFTLDDQEYEETLNVMDMYGAVHSTHRIENSTEVFMSIVRQAKFMAKKKKAA